jgi:protoporphyrinogen/coproporphyrinogen III oxidase
MAPSAPGQSAPSATPDDVPTVVVVGAGISGLAAAWALARSARPPRVVVLEGSARVGGKLALDEVAGLTVDVGAESLLARRPEAVDLARDVGLGDLIEHPRPVGAAIWSGAALRPLPPRTLMGVPSGDQGLAGLLTPTEVERVDAEPGRSWPGVDADVDVASFVGSRVGPAVVDRLVEPLLGGVYAGRADRLSLQATMPALWPAALAGRSLVETAAAATAPRPGAHTGASLPVFAGIRGGVGRLPLALVEALRARGAEVVTGAMVRRLERSGRGWRVCFGPTGDEQVVEAHGVVLAVPAAPASRLLATAAPDAARALAEVPYASMAIVTVVLPRDGMPPLSGSGFLVPPVEGLRVKAATFSSAKWGWLGEAAGDRVVLRASVGRYGEVDELQRTDRDLVRDVLADLARVLGPLPRPVAARVSRWGGGLPQYTVGHVDRIARVRRGVAELPGVAVCGAAYDGVGIPACIASGAAAATAVLHALVSRAA